MKTKIYILLTIVLSIDAKCINAQNLVPNYSFESYDSCIFGAGQVYHATPWKDPTNASSDYFNVCNIYGDGVPSNFAGSQNAKDGNAYIGIVMYADTPGTNYREYIQVKLTDTLIVNKCYRLTFFVSIGDLLDYYKVTNFGACFTSTAITTCTQCVLPYTPQINYYDLAGIGDTTNWYKIDGIFKATGNEQYMTLGNFNNDATTTRIIFNSSCPTGGWSYYYIDSVSLVQVICPIDIGITENFNSNPPFKLYPNPNAGNMIFEYSLPNAEHGSFNLYDVTGRLVNSLTLNGGLNNVLKISEDQLQNGTYIYQVVVNGELKATSRVVIIK